MGALISPVDVLRGRAVVSMGGLAPVAEESLAAALTLFSGLCLVVPRHPFMQQDCKLPVEAASLPRRSLCVGADVAVG